MRGEGKPVLLFLNHWAAHLGGAEFSLIDILDISARRAQVHLVTSENGELVRRAKEMGVSCHVIFCRKGLERIRRSNLLFKAFLNLPSLVSFLIFFFRVRRLVLQIRPDCIHANVPKSHILLLLLKLMGYQNRSVFHIREIFQKESFAYKLYRQLFKPVDSTVIAISNAVRNALPENMKQNSVLIYNGIPMPPPSVLKSQKQSGINFVYLGRIVPWKGCHLLIEAFSKVNSKHKEKQLSLTLAGGTFYWSESYRDELRRLISAHGLDTRCFLLPHVANVYSFLARHDVFCTAALDEPFGRSVAEAQSCALPVIAFDSGGIPEIVENGISGVLVRRAEVEEYSRAMEKFILDPPLALRMGLAGQSMTKGMFNSSVQIPRIVQELL
ncbi:MAG: glycosyltransferase family 4 protein [Chitinispirillaceae bacterium]